MAFSVALKRAVEISRTVTAHSEILCQIIFERTTFITINADQNGLGSETDISKSILAEPFLCHACTQIPAPSSPVLPMSLCPFTCRLRWWLLPGPCPSQGRFRIWAWVPSALSQGRFGSCHCLKTWTEGECGGGTGAQALPGRCS